MKEASIVLEIENLHVHFPVVTKTGLFTKKREWLRAVNGVTVQVRHGETLGVVGESGCGKSTFARSLVGLSPITSGSVRWNGQELSSYTHHQWRKHRKDFQMIFQDPLASLNPRMTIGDSIAEPLRILYPKLPSLLLEKKLRTMMDMVGLLPQVRNRYPHEFSGGQCQRVGIARALIIEPQILVCDEPVSALDVSIQAQVINLLQDLQKEMGLTMIFIGHDLAVVQHISNRVMVMYLGESVELGECDTIYQTPMHPYTQALLEAVPVHHPKDRRSTGVLEGELPSPLHPPSGCVFRTRCPQASEECSITKPLLEGSFSHAVSCLKVDPL